MNKDFERPEKDNVDIYGPSGQRCLPRRNTRTILLIALHDIIVVVGAILGAVLSTKSNDDDDDDNKGTSKDDYKPLHQSGDLSDNRVDVDGDGTVDEKDLILLVRSLYAPHSAPLERALFALSEKPTTQMPAASTIWCFFFAQKCSCKDIWTGLIST